MNAIVVGAYWGDEGKGKIVDLLAAGSDWVVRYNGGDNAGHTIVAGGKKVVLKVKDEKELFKYRQIAEDAGLKTALITDAGHTVVEPGTITCLGIGPDSEEKIDNITGKLKMM